MNLLLSRVCKQIVFEGAYAMTNVSDLIPILQVAVGPVILISGVGLLILSMTNRLGRAIDRTRSLIRLYQAAEPDQQTRLETQLQVLWGRAKTLRMAIALSSASVLSAALLVISIFIAALWGFGSGWVIIVLFSSALISLILSLVLFIHDINQSLAALYVEMEYSQGSSEWMLKDQG
jgi:hypothetical protein